MIYERSPKILDGFVFGGDYFYPVKQHGHDFCWKAVRVLFSLTPLGTVAVNPRPSHRFLIRFFSCFSFLNSCVNPVALYCVSGVFRAHFNRYLCCQDPRWPRNAMSAANCETSFNSTYRRHTQVSGTSDGDGTRPAFQQ
jgi:hypothetical protein